MARIRCGEPGSSNATFRDRGPFFICLFLWMLALVLPVTQVSGGPGLFQHKEEATFGWSLALMGWLGPYGSAFEWYANFPFLVCLPPMWEGRKPPKVMAVVGLLIASTVFFVPAHIGDLSRSTTDWFRGPAVYTWFLAFVLVAFRSFTLIDQTKA